MTSRLILPNFAKHKLVLPELIEVFDAVAIDTIPAWAENFLVYESTIALVKARFPGYKKIFTITTDGDPTKFLTYDGIDCESGDADPATAAQWSYNKIAQHLGRPWIYVEIENRHIVVDELADRGLAFGRDVDCWIARWLDSATPPTFIPEGVYGGWQWGVGNVGWQYHNDSRDTWDSSVVSKIWAFPPTPQEVHMTFDAIQIVATKEYPDGGTFLDAGSVWVGPLDAASLKELAANQAKVFKSTTNSIFNGKTVAPYPAAT